MKRFLMIILIFVLSANTINAEDLNSADYTIFADKNNKYYGMKDSDGKIIVDAEYKKLIRLGENGLIFQKKNNKFGLIDNKGNITVEPKYKSAERIYDKLAKLGKNSKYGVFDEYGNVILPVEYSLIEPMFGQRFLTCKNHKYGVYTGTGEEILPNEYEYIYSPTFRTVRVKYNGIWYEAESKELDNISFDYLDDYGLIEYDTGVNLPKIFKNTGIGAGYGVVTATDYTLKIFSSVSVAYEETIDELLFSKGVDTVPDLLNFSWVIKFPFVFAKRYYGAVLTPDSGPLSGVRNELKEQIK